MSDSRVIVALDYADCGRAFELVGQLDPSRCRVKVGKELFTVGGPQVVRELIAQGFDVFLDLKFHDIPSTVEGACRAASDLGVWMLNVHAAGGRHMMEAARRAIESVRPRPYLIAVTMLTSLDRDDIREVGFSGTVRDNVRRLVRLASSSGLDGVVCSPQELSCLRKEHAHEFLAVTPGIRAAGSDRSDQKRVMSPLEAIQFGASYIVVGRPITGAPDPLEALFAIESEVAKSLSNLGCRSEQKPV